MISPHPRQLSQDIPDDVSRHSGRHEGASPSALARTQHISRSWIYELLGRFKQGGYDSSTLPTQVGSEVHTRILELRAGSFAGHHLAHPQASRSGLAVRCGILLPARRFDLELIAAEEKTAKRHQPERDRVNVPPLNASETERGDRPPIWCEQAE